MTHTHEMLNHSEEFRLGKQVGANELATLLMGKVDATELYMAHQQLSQSIALRVPTNPATHEAMGTNL